MPSRFALPHLTLLLCGVILPSTAFAQDCETQANPCMDGIDDSGLGSRTEVDAAPTSFEIGEITIIGSPLPEAKGDAAYAVTSVAPANGPIENSLRAVAGLAQFRRTDARSANATSQGATMRGLGGNASSRALVMLDGVPQSDPFGGWITWPAYAPERLGRIRVTRGGGSGTAGAGALTGLIELESTGNPQTQFSADYGSRNSIDASALVGGKLGTGTAFVNAHYARGDGFVPITASQRGPADRAAPYEQISVSGRAVVPLSGATEIQAAALAFTDRRTRGTILSGNGGDGGDASVRLVHKGAWDWQALAYVQVRKFQSRFVSIDATRSTVAQTVDQHNVPSTGLGGRFEVRPPLGEAVELRLGGDWRRTTGSTREFFSYSAGLPTRQRLAGGSADTLGGFAEASAILGDLTLTGGGRIDRWWLGAGSLTERVIASQFLARNDSAAARRGWEPTGRAGMAWQAGDLKVRAAAYLGWRLPTLNELYRPFRVGNDATAANSALRPERMKGAEIGAEWRIASGLWLELTAFENRLDDAIANVTLSSTPTGTNRQRQNLNGIRSRGVEADVRLMSGDWDVRASYALTNATIDGTGLALPLDGLRPAQVAKHMASASVAWKGISASARYVSGQFEDDLNQRRLKGALTFDAGAEVQMRKGLWLTARGENLTNRRVEAAISAAGIIERATPRTLWLGFKLVP